MTDIELIQDDITLLKVDAIVNAANRSLLGGGGVDGAIHKAAGPELLQECKTLNGCHTGEAKITKAYRLHARYIIHTVGPVFYNWPKDDACKLLKNAYSNSLKLALEYQIGSIAFPNISTGIYGFPKVEAANIALDAVQAFIKSHQQIQKVIFCCFDKENFKIYSGLLNN
jgi:O-acetyl-ADP-ribose deacetylase (regulator of RNase III)